MIKYSINLPIVVGWGTAGRGLPPPGNTPGVLHGHAGPEQLPAIHFVDGVVCVAVVVKLLHI